MKVKIKLNKAGVRSLLQSEMMMDAIKKEAEKQGKVDTFYVGFDRVQVVVKEEGKGD